MSVNIVFHKTRTVNVLNVKLGMHLHKTSTDVFLAWILLDLLTVKYAFQVSILLKRFVHNANRHFTI